VSEGAIMLRPWTTEVTDIAAVRAAFAHGDVARQAYEPPTDDVSARAWLQRRIDQTARDVSLAIDVDGQAVGGVRLSSISPAAGTAWIGYWLAPEARGRGLATRAVASLSRWAFEELDLYRIVLAHRVNNPESGAVAERAGFVVEGIERASVVFEGNRFDARRWSLLRTDPRPRIEPLPMTVPPR
jgi:[ribosomal protein S5]-alanine N-acetyltransferase